ncbi:MAG: efflux RND transporter periplasmic adaptor subunit [Planctomycetaceae bacterium]|nr:efflux RND transporter periplasmic adaptor subunit [Planctomycetaceae bacterium]
MKKKLKKFLPIIIILIIAVVGYMIWRSTRETSYGPNFASGNGRLEATEIDVSTKLAGRVNVINVDEGDFVTRGQLLAVMQTDTLEAQLYEALAQVANARAAETAARAQIAVRQSDVDAARATVAQRQSELDQTQRRLGRSSVLSERGVITGQQFDDDETTEMAARAAVGTAEAQVDVALAAVEAAKADAEGAAASVKAAEASVASIQADLNDCHLVAPRDGRVQYRITQPGEVLAAGGRVLNFVDLSDVYMNIFLPAEQAGRTAIGAQARILLDAFPHNPIPATVTYVAETAQFTPKTVETESERQKLMFRVKAKINPDILSGNLHIVKPGLPGVTWIQLDPNDPWPEELRYVQTAPARPAPVVAPTVPAPAPQAQTPAATVPTVTAIPVTSGPAAAPSGPLMPVTGFQPAAAGAPGVPVVETGYPPQYQGAPMTVPSSVPGSAVPSVPNAMPQEAPIGAPLPLSPAPTASLPASRMSQPLPLSPTPAQAVPSRVDPAVPLQPTGSASVSGGAPLSPLAVMASADPGQVTVVTPVPTASVPAAVPPPFTVPARPQAASAPLAE